jgi:hypothetical protein
LQRKPQRLKRQRNTAYPHAEVFLVVIVDLRSYTITFLTPGSFSIAKKATKRRAWTPEHLRTLTALARKKTHAARIAKTLKRSEGATRQKAFSMGLSLDSRV